MPSTVLVACENLHRSPYLQLPLENATHMLRFLSQYCCPVSPGTAICGLVVTLLGGETTTGGTTTAGGTTTGGTATGGTTTGGTTTAGATTTGAATTGATTTGGGTTAARFCFQFL